MSQLGASSYRREFRQYLKTNGECGCLWLSSPYHIISTATPSEVVPGSSKCRTNTYADRDLHSSQLVVTEEPRRLVGIAPRPMVVSGIQRLSLVSYPRLVGTTVSLFGPTVGVACPRPAPALPVTVSPTRPTGIGRLAHLSTRHRPQKDRGHDGQPKITQP